MPPIVFVPGLLCSAEVFAPQTAALWQYGPVMVASTLTGTTIPEIAAAILEAAPSRFALASISMGGYISFEIMRQAPERVIKLALLDTSARPDTSEQIVQRRMLVEQARNGDFAEFITEALSSILHPSRQNDPAIRAINRRMAQAVGIDGLARQTEAIIARIDSRPGLGNISVPTLVLVGDSDRLTPLDRAREIKEAIPHAALVVVPACGHGSTLEQPEIVNNALIEWIAG